MKEVGRGNHAGVARCFSSSVTDTAGRQEGPRRSVRPGGRRDLGGRFTMAMAVAAHHSQALFGQARSGGPGAGAMAPPRDLLPNPGRSGAGMPHRIARNRAQLASPHPRPARPSSRSTTHKRSFDIF